MRCDGQLVIATVGPYSSPQILFTGGLDCVSPDLSVQNVPSIFSLYVQSYTHVMNTAAENEYGVVYNFLSCHLKRLEIIEKKMSKFSCEKWTFVLQ